MIHLKLNNSGEYIKISIYNDNTLIDIRAIRKVNIVAVITENMGEQVTVFTVNNINTAYTWDQSYVGNQKWIISEVEGVQPTGNIDLLNKITALN